MIPNSFASGARAMQDLILLELNSTALLDIPAESLKKEIYKLVSQMTVQSAWLCANGGSKE